MDTNAEKALQNRYDRLTVAPGIVGWVYEYRNPQRIHKRDAMASGLEIGVQLCGEWWQRADHSGARLYGPGDIHTLSPAENYELSCQARERPGVQVGFILYPDEVAGYSGLAGALRFAATAPQTDRAFLSFCRDLHRESERREFQALEAASIASEVRSFVERHCELLPSDPLLLAKREIDRHYTSALYVQQIADLARMHPVTFARHFARRFGTTPVRYRLLLRLNEAARQTWACPELSIPQIATRVGFEDPVYFFRAFKQFFGMTPAQYGRRTLAAH